MLKCALPHFTLVKTGQVRVRVIAEEPEVILGSGERIEGRIVEVDVKLKVLIFALTTRQD